jgi:hypothetical protein
MNYLNRLKAWAQTTHVRPLVTSTPPEAVGDPSDELLAERITQGAPADQLPREH